MKFQKASDNKCQTLRHEFRKVGKVTDTKHTVSIAPRSRRHIPCRLYMWRVPMNGISANWFPWILFHQVLINVIVTFYIVINCYLHMHGHVD